MRCGGIALLLMLLASCGRESATPPRSAGTPTDVGPAAAPTSPAPPGGNPTASAAASDADLHKAAWARVRWPGGDVVSSHRLERLDEPVRAGSIFKLVAARAALEQGDGLADLRVACPRRVDTHRRRADCVHPDLGRPLSLEDAIAHSCNHYFVKLAERLDRARLVATMRRLSGSEVEGVADAPLPLVVLGLEGPRLPMREWARVALGALASSASASDAGRLPRAAARAASEGSAAALHDPPVLTLAKTGTTFTVQGQQEGMVVAWRPELGEAVVVRVAGGAGRDAAHVARIIWDRAAAARERVVRVGRVGGADDAGPDVRVDDVPIETYVAGVVAAEGERALPAAALEALAVLARSYAAAPDGRHERDGYHVCDTTHCQVYGAATAWSSRAARATRGRVLAHAGRVAAVPYAASCSGTLVDAADVWGGAVVLKTRVGPDPGRHPVDTWTSEITAEALARVLRAGGHAGDVLRDVRVLTRGRAGMPARVAVDGLVRGEIEATRLRHLVGRGIGWHVLKSHTWDVTRTARGYRFDGTGKGHGAGLCVRGAAALAAGGARAADVLEAYVPGARVQALGDDVRIQVPSTLMGRAGRLRDHVHTILVQLRAQLAVFDPREIELRVHPTHEAYQRATGRAWWTSASTRAVGEARYRVDMAPPLRDGHVDALLPTLRHELVHVLTQAALAEAPAWAVEGLAVVVAQPERFATASGASAAACPADAEVMRPGGAGAMEDTYRSAAACVARLTPGGVGEWRQLALPF